MPTIRLDLDALIARGELTTDEAQRLTGLALPERAGRLWISCLLIFGALAVAGAVIALVPVPATGLALAILAIGGGAFLRYRQRNEALQVLAAALGIMGAVGLSGWIAAEAETIATFFSPQLAITLVLGTCAVLNRSSFLTALTVLSVGALLGSGTLYWFASYGLVVREPTLTILAFTALAGGLYAVRPRLATGSGVQDWANMATVAARTSVILAHFGFWVGSLFGDHPGEHWVAGSDWRASEEWRQSAFLIPELVFSIGWALAAAALIVLNRRNGFLAVSAVVFLAIHGYTQYFETFGTHPMAMLIAGLLAVAMAAAGAHWTLQRGKAA